jgi:hypothetical protein
MKKNTKIWFTSLVIICVLFIPTSSCKKDKNVNNPAYHCESFNTGCGSASACCSLSDCYYMYNNKKYPCHGIDCVDAATQLASDMCGTSQKSASVPLNKTDQEKLELTKTVLLKAIRSCATCP